MKQMASAPFGRTTPTYTSQSLPGWPIPLTSPLQQQSAFTRFFGNEKGIHNLIQNLSISLAQEPVLSKNPEQQDGE